MKILLNQNNQQIGPYTKEEIHEMVYRGEVQRSTLACVEGSSDWLPVETLLTPAPAPATSAPPLISIPLDRLRDPQEKTALIWLYIAAVPGALFLVFLTVASFGGLLVVFGLGALMLLFGELWFGAYVKANAVRVSPTQLPQLFQVVEACCYKLGMPLPDVYILQENVWNAFATKVLARRVVVLLSGAVDSILLKGDLRQMAWLVGHELGHHRAGHLDFLRKVANLGDWCVWLKLWYSRRAELTCDRIGLYCTGSLHSSQLALMNATVGAQLASQVNLAEAVRQWQQHRGEFFVRYRTLYSTHPHHLARLDHLAHAAGELGIAG